MYQDNSFFDKIRENVNVSDVVRQKVSLTKKGGEYLGLCPFHNEKTPSFTVNDFKKFYHCFGCGAHGDAIKFLVETGGFSYLEAAKKLAGEYGIPIPKQSQAQVRINKQSDQIIETLKTANSFFTSHIDPPAKRYLNERGLTDEIIKEYEIGFSGSGKESIKFLEEKGISAPQMLDAGILAKGEDGDTYPVFRKRITFPIKNIYGKIIAFGGRILGSGMPKYLNSPESLVFKKSETLYGEDVAIGAAYRSKRIIIVEGYLDVIAMHRAGFKECVATLGTAVTKEHLTKLWRIADELIFCLDGDEAGIRAMKKAISLLLPALSSSRRASFLVLPGSMDPDEAIKKFGAKHIEELIGKRLSTSEMIWNLETSGKEYNNAEARASLESKLNQFVKLITDNVLANHIKRDFKNKIWNLGRKKTPQNIRKSSKDSQINQIKKESDIIEYNLCAIIYRKPSILEDEVIYDQFMHLAFKNHNCRAFQSLVIEIHDESGNITAEILKENMQKPSFSELFILLSSSGTLMLDLLSLNNADADYNLLWELFIKKYELGLLKSEYAEAINSNQDDGFEKAKAYLEEIRNVEVKLDELKEALTS